MKQSPSDELRTLAIAVTGTVLVLAMDISRDAHAGWWEGFGSGFPFDAYVYSLADYEGQLIVAGNRFGPPVGPGPNIARWDGAGWDNPFGEGVNAGIRDLAVYQGDPHRSGRLHVSGWVLCQQDCGLEHVRLVATWPRLV